MWTWWPTVAWTLQDIAGFIAWNIMYEYGKCFDHKQPQIVVILFFQFLHVHSSSLSTNQRICIYQHVYMYASFTLLECFFLCSHIQSYIKILTLTNGPPWLMTTLSSQRMHFTFLTQLPVMKSLSLMLMDHGAPMKSLCYPNHMTLNILISLISLLMAMTAFACYVPSPIINSRIVISIVTHLYLIAVTSKGPLSAHGRTRSILLMLHFSSV